MLSALSLLPLPPSSLVIKAASGREKLTHYDLHKNLIPGRRRIPVMQNGSGLALASNRALVVMSFGERLVAAPACVNYVSLFVSFYKFCIFRGCKAVKAQGNVARICLVIAQTSFEEEMLSTLLAAVSYDSINTSVNFGIIATA